MSIIYKLYINDLWLQCGPWLEDVFQETQTHDVGNVKGYTKKKSLVPFSETYSFYFYLYSEQENIFERTSLACHLHRALYIHAHLLPGIDSIQPNSTGLQLETELDQQQSIYWMTTQGKW